MSPARSNAPGCGGSSIAPEDHRIGWAIYCDDPDGTGLEISWDSR